MSTPNGMEKLLTVNEVAVRLGVTYQRVWQLISEGRLDAERIRPRVTRIRESALSRYQESRRELIEVAA